MTVTACQEPDVWAELFCILGSHLSLDSCILITACSVPVHCVELFELIRHERSSSSSNASVLHSGYLCIFRCCVSYVIVCLFVILKPCSVQSQACLCKPRHRVMDVQSSIVQCLSQPRINFKDCGRNGIWHRMVGMVDAEALTTQMSWRPVVLSVWMPLLASLALNKTGNTAGFGGLGIISGLSLPLDVGVSAVSLPCYCLWPGACQEHGIRLPMSWSCRLLSRTSFPMLPLNVVLLLLQIASPMPCLLCHHAIT